VYRGDSAECAGSLSRCAARCASVAASPAAGQCRSAHAGSGPGGAAVQSTSTAAAVLILEESPRHMWASASAPTAVLRPRRATVMDSELHRIRSPGGSPDCTNCAHGSPSKFSTARSRDSEGARLHIQLHASMGNCAPSPSPCGPGLEKGCMQAHPAARGMGSQSVEEAANPQ